MDIQHNYVYNRNLYLDIRINKEKLEKERGIKIKSSGRTFQTLMIFIVFAKFYGLYKSRYSR